MAEVKHTEIFACTPDQFFDIISEYAKYPEFLSEVKDCKVIEDSGVVKKVEFKISIIKNFRYLNEHREERPKKLSWKFIEGDLFKTMNGYWELSEENGKTKAVYFVEATFGLFVPKKMTEKALSVNLPAMMKAYHGRVRELYGAS